MPLYESVFIARQDISAPQVESLTEELSKLIEDQGAKVVKTEYWGLRSLAYKIRKNRKGHYVLYGIDGPSAAVQELERRMRLNEDVLRYLTVKVDAIEEGPSVMMQRGPARDDRSRRDGGPRRRDREHEAAPRRTDSDKVAAPPKTDSDKDAAPAKTDNDKVPAPSEADTKTTEKTDGGEK